MSEQFCLTWSEYSYHIQNGLRSDNDFCDVTLVSDDHHEFKAHKVILSTCSEYFKTLLRNKKDSHPLICLQGLSCQELKNLITYCYSGEVMLEKFNLERFMSIAKRLELQGLTDSREKPFQNDIINKIDDIKIDDIEIERKQSKMSIMDAPIQKESDDFSNFNPVKDDEVSNALVKRKAKRVLKKAVVKGTETPNDATHNVKETEILPENTPALPDYEFSRQYSDRTVFNEELEHELQHIQFTRTVTPLTNMYDCKICHTRKESFFEAKGHFEKHHQNVEEPKKVINEMMNFMTEEKKKIKSEKRDVLKTKFPDISSELKNRLAILQELNDLTLNQNLRYKKKKL